MHTYSSNIHAMLKRKKKHVPMENEKIVYSELRWNYSDQLLKLLTDNAP